MSYPCGNTCLHGRSAKKFMANTGIDYMTKLEAWKAWSAKSGSAYLASDFTLERSSHGKAFSFAWDAATERAAKLLDDMAAKDKLSNYYKVAAKAVRAQGE